MMRLHHVLAVMVAAGGLQAGAALAQTPTGATATNATATSSAGDDAAMKQAVDQRIGALQSKLSITPAQMNDWNSFAQAMRDNASSTNDLFKQRAQNAGSMSAVDNMKSYAAIARAYADNTEHLATSFATLYGKLSPDQQKTADELFRQPPPPAQGGSKTR